VRTVSNIRSTREGVDIELRVARRVAERFDDGIEIRLAGAAAHGGDSSVGDVDSRFGRFQDGAALMPLVSCV